jgi:hypothetical protein
MSSKMELDRINFVDDLKAIRTNRIQAKHGNASKRQSAALQAE